MCFSYSMTLTLHREVRSVPLETGWSSVTPSTSRIQQAEVTACDFRSYVTNSYAAFSWLARILEALSCQVNSLVVLRLPFCEEAQCSPSGETTGEGPDTT